jgi:hypothetical protein
MVSVLLLTGFLTKVYATEDFPTSDLGVSPSVVGASGEFREVKITVSDIPGQTGESVTVADLTPSPCSTQIDITCTGPSHIAIPGIGEGHPLVILHNHRVQGGNHDLSAAIFVIVAVGFALIPLLLSNTNIALGNGTTVAAITGHDISGLVGIQLL